MKTNILIIGGGGHAKVLIDCLQQIAGVNLLGILDNNEAVQGQSILGIPVLGGDDKIAEFASDAVQLVNAVGSVDVPKRRKMVYEYFRNLGYQFYTVIHPTACIAKSVKLYEGVQVMAGAILQVDCCVGENVIINTGAIVDHDVVLGDHIHIAPGVVISGNVTIGEGTHVGARAVVLQGLQIAEQCLIGAGAVVINNISAASRVVGVPAKNITVITEELVHESME